MAELTPKERLQPSLLDRLTDEEPDKAQESREQRVLSMNRLRLGVLRDLAWLFNSTRMPESSAIERYPFAAHSVINFGLPPLSGVTARSLDVRSRVSLPKRHNTTNRMHPQMNQMLKQKTRKLPLHMQLLRVNPVTILILL